MTSEAFACTTKAFVRVVPSLALWVTCALFEKLIPPKTPSVKLRDECFFIRTRKCLRKRKELHSRRKYGVECRVANNNLQLMEVAHLYRKVRKQPWDSDSAVSDECREGEASLFKLPFCHLVCTGCFGENFFPVHILMLIGVTDDEHPHSTDLGGVTDCNHVPGLWNMFGKYVCIELIPYPLFTHAVASHECFHAGMFICVCEPEQCG